ncbi:MAG TPA: hypothetical protein ENI93_02230 [Gammaproteobacteria bacterium]|nr:hypothetical protein [Gammaproteobacteria bacterium]
MPAVSLDVAGGQGICRTGIPFPQGLLTTLAQLRLEREDEPVDCFCRPLSHWPDGSIRWLNIGFFHAAGATGRYRLHIHPPAPHRPDENPPAGLEAVEEDGELCLRTTTASFRLGRDTLTLAGADQAGNPVFSSLTLAPALRLADGSQPQAVLDDLQPRKYRTPDGAAALLEITLTGHYRLPDPAPPLRFTTELAIYHAQPQFSLSACLHNAGAAHHPGGCWDLGDAGSAWIDSLSLRLDLPENDALRYRLAPGEDWHPAPPALDIAQFASGGENWDSPVHVDADGVVALAGPGFEVRAGQACLHRGSRATPALHSDHGLDLALPRFWQNFPGALSLAPGRIRVDLFPRQDGRPHELQGGEKKTRTVWFSLGAAEGDLDWVHAPPAARPDAGWLAREGHLPGLHDHPDHAGIERLIAAGLDGEDNFFAKRERIDEYGWRHFGDLYADHETAHHRDDSPFPSHYNNQYDPVYGFLRQFLRGGDPRWFELADDLARHVTDIDIYDTEQDRAEYNGGLFWHTDHYSKAHTSSHRSYSRLQGDDAYEDRSGGGGPGGQHCYTTGLALHHLLTGNEASRAAVFRLTAWIGRVYDGDDTLLGLLLAIRNRRQPGLRDPVTGRYPLDRGTGNYVAALLDCHLLTADPAWLARAGRVIRHTVHPRDDIARRELENTEEHWFYTAFLQTVARYLDEKTRTGERDGDFLHARDALLHYADWMLANESPYLAHPERLEFPNDTWCAQDLRKAHVLAAASHYAPDGGAPYLARAREFEDYVADHLSGSKEAGYTRILALLMQNHGFVTDYARRERMDHPPRRSDWPAPRPGLAPLGGALRRVFARFSPAREIRWLKTRLG